MSTQIIGLLILILSGSAYGQNTLEDYISIGLKNNEKLLRENLALKISENQMEEAKNKYYPRILLEASYTLSEGGRTIDIPAGDLLNPVYSSLNHLLNENAFLTISNVREQLLPNDFHETKIRLLQPVFNSSIYYTYKAEKVKISVALARREAMENQLKKQIKIGYYQYLSSVEKLSVLENGRILLQDIVKLNQNMVREGVYTKETVLGSQVQVQKINSEIAATKKKIQSSRAYFNYLLNRNLQDSILVSPNDTNFSMEFIDLDNLKQQAINNRQELQQTQNALKVNEMYGKLSKSQVFPNLNLIGDIGYQGFGYDLSEKQEFWFLQLRLTWDIFNGFQNQHKTKQTQINKDILVSQYSEVQNEILLEVINAYYGLQEAHEIYMANLAELQYAEETFRILLKKYQNNLALPLNLNEARSNYTNAHIQVVISRYNLKIKEAEIKAAANLI